MAFLERDGKRIYFEHHQGSGVTIALVHGWGTGSRIWDVVTAALIDAGFGVLLFDQRGCSNSDKDFERVNIEASASDLTAIVESLDLQNVVLCGWSIGGAVSTAALPGLAGRCTGLVSVCGATPRFVAAPDFPGAPEGSAAAMVKQLRAGRAPFLAWLAANSVAKEVDPADIERMRWIMGQSSPVAEGGLLDLDVIDLRDVFSATDVPILIISGAKDILVDPAIQQAAASLARNGSIEIFDECGHTPFIEEPARFCETLISFVSRLR